MKTVKWLDDHLEEAFLVICLVIIAVVMMIQVIVRKIPGVPPLQWAEELCRFMWIMSVFISIPYTIRKSSMLRVTVLMDLLPEGLRKVINILVDIAILCAMAILAYNSIGVFNKIVTSNELSPAMRMPMSFVYIFMLIGFFLGTFRAAQMAVLHVKNFNERMLSTTEQTMQDAKEEASAGQRAEGGE